jgi:REP element-mobilizing transposase RayT
VDGRGRPSLHRPLIRHNHMSAAITAFERESWYYTSMQRHYDYRRKLPHLQPDNKIFFISFSTSKRWMLPNRARDIVMETCLRGDGHRFELHALVVMPDHVHLALTPRRDEAVLFAFQRSCKRSKASRHTASAKKPGMSDASGKRSRLTGLSGERRTRSPRFNIWSTIRFERGW